MPYRQQVGFIARKLLESVFCALPLITVGCSDDQIPLGTVQGDMTFNGLPVLAEVLFEPEADGRSIGVRPSTAYTDKNGHFDLMYGSSRHGALVGRHRVTIKVFQTTDTTDSTDRTADPEKIVYLVREIVPGNNRLQFALSY